MQQSKVRIALKLDRALFIAIIGIVNAGATLLASILPFYLPPQLSDPIVVFIDAIANVLVIYFSTEAAQLSTT